MTSLRFLGGVAGGLGLAAAMFAGQTERLSDPGVYTLIVIGAVIGILLNRKGYVLSGGISWGLLVAGPVLFKYWFHPTPSLSHTILLGGIIAAALAGGIATAAGRTRY